MTTLTGLTPREEQRAQLRMLMAAERRFGRVLASILSTAYGQMIDRFEATRGVPQLPDELRPRIEAAYADMAAIMIEAFGERILEQGKARGLDLETKQFAELFQRLALEFISQEAIRARITNVIDTTRNVIVSRILRGQEEGEGVDAIARGLRDLVPSLSRHRGALIARTETHGAANFGADQAARATGLRLKKEWVSADDHRTRDFGQGDGVVDEFDHRSANGQTVDMDQPFQIARRNGTVEALMFPGDPAGSAANVINCRCASVQMVDDPDF